MIKRFYIVLLFIFSVLIACEKIQTVSPVPAIDFKEFTLVDVSDTSEFLNFEGELVFSFVDGDGDIGLYPYDLLNEDSTDKYNFFLLPYRKVDTQYIEIDLDEYEVPPFYRILHNEKMDRVGQNKTLKGDISLKIQYPEEKPYESNTIKYEFYIIDRAGNQSNTETTTDIGF